MHNTTDKSILCLAVLRVIRQKRQLESPTFEDLLRLSCGLGLDIVTATYFPRARDKHFLNKSELGTFFFK